VKRSDNRRGKVAQETEESHVGGGEEEEEEEEERWLHDV
jgi:hypothetical protein